MKMSNPSGPQTVTLLEMQQISPKCCFCIPVKIACFSLGYLTLLINAVNTLIVLGVFIFSGMMSQGFRYLQSTTLDDGQFVSDINSVDPSIIRYFMLLVGIMVLWNVIWLVWNICILVGLHKKHPRHIRLNVSIAALRFVILSIFLVTSVGPSNTVDYIVMTGAETSITGFFMLTYYSYATQLVRKNKMRVLAVETMPVPETSITDSHFAYPKVLDLQHLVEKEKY